MPRPEVVVVPAYNAAKTIEKTYADIPAGVVDHIILVDDVSQGETVDIAQRLSLEVVMHIQNPGYGGNQKTCYLHALAADADFDKFVSNRFLTIFENLVLGQHLSECHTGFRAYSRRTLETIPFVLNSEDFVFDTQIIIQTVALGFKIAEIAVPTRYFKEASSVNFGRSVVYGFGTLKTPLDYGLDRVGLRPNRLFRKKLDQVISRYHHQRLLRSSRTLLGMMSLSDSITPKMEL